MPSGAAEVGQVVNRAMNATADPQFWKRDIQDDARDLAGRLDRISHLVDGTCQERLYDDLLAFLNELALGGRLNRLQGDR